jgi:large subunit ribosomal protein LP1
LQALFKVANLRVEPFWSKVYEKALKGKNIGELLVGGGAPAPAAQTAATATKEAPKEAAKAPAKVEKGNRDLVHG